MTCSEKKKMKRKKKKKLQSKKAIKVGPVRYRLVAWGAIGPRSALIAPMVFLDSAHELLSLSCGESRVTWLFPEDAPGIDEEDRGAITTLDLKTREMESLGGGGWKTVRCGGKHTAGLRWDGRVGVYHLNRSLIFLSTFENERLAMHGFCS